ncbi:MAG: hypothetical protein Kow002_09830 [Anaerolineales bacterium]
MIILITALLPILVALSLVLLYWMRPNFRFFWLVALAGGFITWVGVLLWRFRLPLELVLPAWEPAQLFSQSLSFMADPLTWLFAFGIATLILVVILTATARENFPAPIPWAATLMLGSFGILAVLADNPLTLLMLWAAIDFVELLSQLRSVRGAQASERAVTAFAARAAGAVALLWASMVSTSVGTPMDFHNAPPQAGLYLLLASGLRLGVLPLHLPYAAESAIRRGFGSTLRLISAGSAIILLARIPTESVISPFTPYLLILVTLAALYGSWMWLRASDELTARPFWLIGLASLATAAALRGNPNGAAAWGLALLLVGTAIFLTSAYQKWLNRALLLGLLGISTLPLSITASGWQRGVFDLGFVWPFLLLAHAMLLAGYVRHALRPSNRKPFEDLDVWARNTYPAGIGLALLVILVLGISAFEYNFQMSALLFAVTAFLLSGLIYWLVPRVRWLQPPRAHWVSASSTATTWLDWFFRALWNSYRTLGRISEVITSILESDGGIIWTLLFLVLLISLLGQRMPGL